MKDELKDFIEQHRAEFDQKQPSKRVWHNIDKKIFGKQGLQPLRYWQAAAVFFFAISIYFWLGNERPVVQSPTASKEFNDTEAFYVEQISEKIKMIHAVNSSDLNGFTQDFKQLEAMYMVLKEEHNQHPSEKIKEAMILNLLVRINLLNQQLYKLDESRQKEQIVEFS